MKKLLVSAICALGAIYSVKAQTTIMSQPFATASIPIGWTENTPASVPADVWIFSNAYGPQLAPYVTTQGYCAYIDDFDNNPNQTLPVWDTLKGPSMNCTAYPSVFVSLNYWFWNDNGNEVATIAVSTDGGISWTTAINLANTTGVWTNGVVYDISAYAGGQANAMIAFTYYNGLNSPTNGYAAVGVSIQDVDVYAPVNYDVKVANQSFPYLMQVGTAYNFSGIDSNFGGDGITSMNMNYTVNQGAPVSQNISAITGFSGLTGYNWSMNSTSSAFTPSSAGTYTVRFFANTLNGSNANVNTDTLVATFLAVDSVKPRKALMEELTGQSCAFCMLAAPNMDSVYDDNALTSSIIRYHVPIPGRDLMYGANTVPSDEKANYYNIPGAPAGYLDGVAINPSTYGNPPESQIYSSITVQADNAIGSPFKIDITSHKYDPVADSFYVSANITAYGAFAAGLSAQVALTIDSIYYPQDMSMDDPQPTFAPPIGSGAGGGYVPADYFYPFVLKFTHVCEEMFPNSGDGTSLAAFTSGQTQTISFGWKRNHPWGAARGNTAHYLDSAQYDSSATGQFVVFIQTNNAIAAAGIPAQYVFQSAWAPVTDITALGIQKISNGVSFQMYPNPTNSNTNLAFKLDKEQNITVEIYTMLGEKIYSNNEGNMSTGMHTISINGSILQNGIYFVRVNSDNGSTTQKLIIQR